MTDTDLDIILAIADGRLTGQAKSDALARIASDPGLGAELAEQIAAMEDLKALEPATMTSAERTALRSALVEQLNLQPAAPVLDMEKHRRPWWQPVLGLTSAAALLMAIVVVPSMLSGSNDSAQDVVAIAPEATTPVDRVAELDDGVPDAATTPSTVLVAQVAAQDVQEFFSSVSLSDATTGSTIAEDLTEAAGGASDDETPDASDISEAVAEPLASSALIAVDAARLEACLSSLADELPRGEHLPFAATLDAGVVTIHFGISTDDGVAYSISIALDTCSITSLNP